MKAAKLLLLAFLGACTQGEMKPENVLKEFVDGSVGNVVNREFVLQRVTGKMEQSVIHMSEEEFALFANLTSLQKEGFKVLSKSCQTTRCFLTYTVTYLSGKPEQSKFKTEVKKIAEVNLVNGKWLIADVSNVKTFHEALEPINPLE
jgi:hypothetical protein